jgi:archaellum component FlaG (FlaF/FlaG flagellin family)
LPRKRSRKGISDVVANLLIMAMVVALFGMVILWASGYLGQSQGIWNVQSRRAQEAIVIETAKYDKATGNLTVYVRNVGTSTVELNVMYINSTSGLITVDHSTLLEGLYEYPPSRDKGDGRIVPRQLVEIEINQALPSGPNRLTLVTTLGADATFIYVVP